MLFCKSIRSAALLFLTLLTLTACAPHNTANRDIPLQPLGLDPVLVEQADNQQSIIRTQYVIAAGDVLEVRYPFRPEFNDQYTVRSDGRISLPFIGSIDVAGKTPEAVQVMINELYSLWANDGTADSGDKQYLIQVSDQLEVKFPYHPELDELVVVRPDGRVSLPLVGAVLAENKTPEDLNNELVDAYSAHLRQPNLVVIVREFSDNKYYLNGQVRRARVTGLDETLVIVRNETPMQIFVGGEVQMPGFFPYTGPVTALQAIIMAGGQRDTGEMRQVAIIRKGEGEMPTLMLRNLNYQIGGEVDETMPVTLAALGDVELRPNDIIIVPQSNIAKVNQYLDQYLYSLIPALRNSSFGFIYNLNPVKKFESVNTTGQ